MRTVYNILKYYIGTFRRILLHARIRARFPTAQIDTRICWQIDTLEALDVGKGVSIGAFSEIVALGKTTHSNISGRLVLGPRCVVGAGANLRAAGGEIHIGANTMLAQQVTIVAANHLCYAGEIYRDAQWDENRTGVKIGQNCWIGAGVVILPGVTIGQNSVIGAGSVVTRDVPANEIWARIPAVKIGRVFARNEMVGANQK